MSSALVLPYYANPAGAFSEPVVLADGAAGQFVTYHPMQGYVEVLLLAFYFYVATAAVGNREIKLVVQDADGNNLVDARPNAVVTASGQISVQFSTSYSAGFTNGQNWFGAPLPSITLFPNYTVFLGASGMPAGDLVRIPALYVTRYPTNAAPPAVTTAAPAKV